MQKNIKPTAELFNVLFLSWGIKFIHPEKEKKGKMQY